MWTYFLLLACAVASGHSEPAVNPTKYPSNDHVDLSARKSQCNAGHIYKQCPNYDFTWHGKNSNMPIADISITSATYVENNVYDVNIHFECRDNMDINALDELKIIGLATTSGGSDVLFSRNMNIHKINDPRSWDATVQIYANVNDNVACMPTFEIQFDWCSLNYNNAQAQCNSWRYGKSYDYITGCNNADNQGHSQTDDSNYCWPIQCHGESSIAATSVVPKSASGKTTSTSPSKTDGTSTSSVPGTSLTRIESTAAASTLVSTVESNTKYTEFTTSLPIDTSISTAPGHSSESSSTVESADPTSGVSSTPPTSSVESADPTFSVNSSLSIPDSSTAAPSVGPANSTSTEGSLSTIFTTASDSESCTAASPTATETVSETIYTTYCPGPTTFTWGGSTYTITKPTTLTITSCPEECESSVTNSDTTETLSETVYTTYCPGPTTITWGGSTYTVTKPTTLTLTSCPEKCESSKTGPVTTATTTRAPGKKGSLSTSSKARFSTSSVTGVSVYPSATSSGGVPIVNGALRSASVNLLCLLASILAVLA